MGPSARTIVELNFQHYRELLKTETDPSKRRTIAKLLAEEEARLAKAIYRATIDERQTSLGRERNHRDQLRQCVGST